MNFPDGELEEKEKTMKKLDIRASLQHYTGQRKSHSCIPRKGIVRPQSQFPQSCVCERFIYSQDRSTYFPAAE